MNKIYRQGDVALVVVSKPASLTKAPEGAEILALGEHSGHGHVAEDCEVMEHDGKKYIIPNEIGAQIKHMVLATKTKGDHNTITLPALDENHVYEVVIQNSYSPFEKVLEPVID